jgi:hypothetical protein
MIDEVFRQAFTDVLYEKAKDVLCPACSKLLHGEALDRYKMLMAKRREEISGLQVKAQKEKEVENRRRDLDKQNKKNNPSKGDSHEK